MSEPRDGAVLLGRARRFALGLWEHQVGNHQTGDFSRHAPIDSHGPDTEAPYARHGGFYIETWAAAYEKTLDEVFLHAIESVLDGLERARAHEGGMLVGGSKRGGGRRPYDISLAVSLGNSAPQVTPELAAKMQAVASTNDKVFAEVHANSGGADGGSLWSNAYGAGAPAGPANVCMLRYRQVGHDAYRRFVLETAGAPVRQCSSRLSTRRWTSATPSTAFSTKVLARGSKTSRYCVSNDWQERETV
ncbi:MAG: hypothetical protein A2V98_02125 [Planctomycetes bacterium RBG_16_64_12]|nr:MAG: hypothetical protein A2V98_02125 [Planctomycetes bacterium RBG_16_64_12]